DRLQLRPALPGRLSATVTVLAVPAPVLLTVTVNPTWSPALTVVASATLLRAMVGQFTVMLTGPALAVPSLPLPADAELVTVPQLAAVVAEITWMSMWAPLARVAKVQLSTWLPAAPVMAQPLTAGDRLQLRPALPGRLSATVTVLAVPAPVLLTVTVNPTWSPEL